MSAAAISEPSVLTEVPDELKRLARFIMRGFYAIEHALIIDILVRNPIVKEDDISELLKFDKKQLRIFVNRLKNDKLIKQTMRVETQPDGRTNRHNYYFINYKVFVDVVKYKLDRMRQKIENKERDSTCKTLFKCPTCLKEYNEFDAGNLMDMLTGLMNCTFCGSEVQEDESAVPKKDAYMQIAIFNEQMKPVFDLLKAVEHVKLSKTLLEPTPSAASDNKRLNNSKGANGPHNAWSGDASRNLGFEMYDQQITINVGEDSQSNQAAKAPTKQRPVWLMESTVDGAVNETSTTSGNLKSLQGGASASSKASSKNKEKDEIIRALLANERKSGTQVVIPGDANSDAESDASASDDDFIGASTSAPITHTVEMDSGDEDDEEEEEMMVMVGGRPVPFQDVTDELVSRMSPAEKEAYIKKGQEAYAAMYD